MGLCFNSTTLFLLSIEWAYVSNLDLKAHTHCSGDASMKASQQLLLFLMRSVMFENFLCGISLHNLDHIWQYQDSRCRQRRVAVEVAVVIVVSAGFCVFQNWSVWLLRTFKKIWVLFSKKFKFIVLKFLFSKVDFFFKFADVAFFQQQLIFFLQLYQPYVS